MRYAGMHGERTNVEEIVAAARILSEPSSLVLRGSSFRFEDFRLRAASCSASSQASLSASGDLPPITVASRL